MKTNRVLTLLVLAVFAMSFSTALSQEKKTRRVTKKEQKAQCIEDILMRGDFLVFDASYNSGLIMTSSGLSYYPPTGHDVTARSYWKQLGNDWYVSFGVLGGPEKVFYDVRGKCKCDMLFVYPGQGYKGDETYLLGYTRGKNSVMFFVTEGSGENQKIQKRGSYAVDLIYGMDDYPENLSSDVDEWRERMIRNSRK